MENYSDELVRNLTDLIKEHDRKVLISSIAEKQKKEKEKSNEMMNTDEISKKVVDFSGIAMDFCKKTLEAQMENPESIDPSRLSAITNLYKAVYSAWFN
ncbi:hypothetical protein H3U50_08300 [Lactobacillus sp. M0398]|uniref:hypothetical protein n=1 Tax=unclassified Lactobacillus TaxID=2620435 RepID=UPI0018DBFFAA|nr:MULTISPECIES: hypothetical protein [unclassified Lactobacillus]MBI0121797.1 hypothetical protein [Lactobacillus sp. M0398]MBI0122108.1 hypothetical protein [Lactobacillus sp. W8174]MBI0134828.1 hypothetical protein [Lactobacillus sp. W8173]